MENVTLKLLQAMKARGEKIASPCSGSGFHAL